MAYIDFRQPPASPPTALPDQPKREHTARIRRATAPMSDCRHTTRLSYLLSAGLVLAVFATVYGLALASIRMPFVAAIVTIVLLLPAAPLIGSDRSHHR